VILSDRTLREQIDAGRIIIEPFDLSMIQPLSIDAHRQLVPKFAITRRP
jgi:dCTP deaminase